MTDDNGRVTTREFFDALLSMRSELQDSERRIISKLDHMIESGTPTARIAANLAEKNESRIQNMESRSNRWDGINSVAVVIGSALGMIFGNK